ncbi:MAG: YbhN family protein [Myxococcota bacterium]
MADVMENESRKRSGWRTAFQLVGLCVFLAYLFRSQDLLLATLSSLGELRLLDFGAACLAMLASQLLVALRTRKLLSIVGFHFSFPKLAADCLRAGTLNTISLVGTGDVYRIARYREAGVPLGVASAVVVLDRLMGIGVLVVLFLCVGLGSLQSSSRIETGFLGFVAMIGGAVVGIALIILFFSLSERWSRGPRFERLRSSLPMLREIAQDPVGGIQLVAISGFAILMWILSVVLLGRGMNLSVPIMGYFEAVPLVALAAMLPITVGGIGIRETGYILLLGLYGVSETACIALGLAQYATFVMLACLGGCLFTMPDRFSKRPLLRTSKG